MKSIRQYSVSVLVELGDTEVDGDFDESAVDDACREHLIEVIKSNVIGSGRTPTQVEINVTALKNEFTPAEIEASNLEHQQESTKIDVFIANLNAALDASDNFIFTSDTLQGIYHYDDCAPANFNDPFITGLVQFTNKHAWLQANVAPFKSKVYNNPTYLDIVEVFETSIRHTGDTHHIFFEGLSEPNDKIVSETGISTYDIKSGS